MGGIAGYLANLDQSKIEESQILDSSEYFYQDDIQNSQEDILSMSALAKQIKNIGSINIQELEAKIQEDEEDFRKSSLEPISANHKRKKSSVLVPNIDTSKVLDIHIDELSESDDEMDTNRDREFFMEQAAKEMAEE